MNLKPLGTQILIRLIDDESDNELQGGLYVPKSARAETTSSRAEVVALGSGVSSKGRAIPFLVKVGDKVLAPRYTERPAIRSGGDTYVIVTEDELLGLIEEDSS